MFFTVRSTRLLEPTCRNGLVGIGSSDGTGDACCHVDCGVCGGPGCSDVGEEYGLNEHDCCTAEISADGELCSEKMEAPCIMDDDVGGEGCCLISQKKYSWRRWRRCPNSLENCDIQLVAGCLKLNRRGSLLYGIVFSDGGVVR